MRQDNVTGCWDRANLREGTNVGTLQVDAFKYSIDSIAYLKSATDNVAFTAAEAQKALTVCAYLVEIDSEGTIQTKKGDEVPVADFNEVAYVQIPTPTAPNSGSTKRWCPIGYVTIETEANTTFTAGTTDLGATGIRERYDNLMGGMPPKPAVVRPPANSGA